ncbi:MAG: hypothetical protein A2511_14880 [Deltaproteobacteria bacterium RIFOXYD12_FULL_50_9]|nr:MAG: hypothetical protein A2511_14880 [Deltaproteobacteria bacterium RIFOXYD12_FULL_50_9]
MNFLDIWYRIKKETPLKSFNDLATLVETSQPNVSRQKKEGIFPPGWAYAVGKKYGLFTEWIMTGEGPKRLSDNNTAPDPKAIPKGIIEEWVKDVREKEGNDGRIVAELMLQVFEFQEWYREKKSKSSEVEISLPRKNVA